MEQRLEPALQEGLVALNGSEHYRFLHDRIQQAAHALIPLEERKAVHLRIGRLLVASLSPEELQERLFDVVSQLNAGAELLTDPAERHRIARLNAEAGAKAQASTAFRSAAAYFAMAFQLLPQDPWEVDPALAFKIRLDQARCESMLGHAAEALQLLEEPRPHARTRLQLSALYRLKSELHMAQGQVHAARDSLLECLSLLGMPMSAHPSWEEVVAAHEEVWALMGSRPIEGLIGLPRLNDPDMDAVMSLFPALYAPSLLTDTNLLILHLCRLVSLSLRHGNSASSIYGYSTYGQVAGHAFGRYHEGYAFAQLSLALVERYADLASGRLQATYSLGPISYWTQPLALSIELFRQAFHQALQASEVQLACYCSDQIVTVRLSLGHELEEVYQESVARLDFLRKVRYREVQDIVQFTQAYVQQLRGLTRSFNTLTCPEFDAEAFEAALTPQSMTLMVCWYWIIQMQSRFMCGEYARALQAGDKAAGLLWSSMGFIEVLDFHLFRALSLAPLVPELSAEERPAALEQLRKHHRQVAEWAGNCPANFRAPERLAFAELSRVSGDEDAALLAYDEALHAAREHGYPQYEAMACELAARFWFKRRVLTIAETYARKAREAYLRWGAHGKAQQLAEQWPQVSTDSPGDGTATDTDSSQIDALTVVKAQQAISGEIVLERLATTLLQVAIENAGAQRGALLLPRGGALSVMAVSGTSDEASEDGQSLPWTLISYVRRTREQVLLGDAAQPHPFSSDGWLERGRIRSVLCLPLLRQGEFRGVLYLENSLATNAFTPARSTLLGHLASQAAISLENARLYAEVQRTEAALRRANDDLEKRVEERTRELKQAQTQLVETARSAGMAEVATSVLHNVGNVLTSAIVNVHTMNETLAASRLGRLKQVSAMLHEHRQALAAFFTEDPRGMQLPGYLEALTEELQREQASLQEGLSAMGMHVEHIRAIVQMQQTFARSTLVTEECDLAQLIGDALSIQMAALQRHGVTIVRELSAQARAQVDKHKVLQILINLISNAKIAMGSLPKGQKQLRVRLETVNNQARIQVVDNGMGFTPEVQARLFSQGFTTRQGGHGLGLHSSALAARMLGGRLTLESAGPGQGATATLELPLA